jgi:DNA-binding PadR family transcriptional regulator
MGKTEGAVRLMAKHLLSDADGVVLYVAPTVMLLKKVEERLKVMLQSMGGKPRHEANILTYNELPGDGEGGTPRGVVHSILEDLSGSARAGGNLLMSARNNAVAFVTHSAFFLLPFEFKNKERVSVVFDEARKCVFEPTEVALTEKELDLFNTYMQDDASPRPSEYRQVSFNTKKLRDLEKLMIDLRANKSMKAFEVNRFLDMVKALKRGTTEVYYLKKRSSKKYKDATTGELKYRTALKFYEVHIPGKVFFGWKRVVLMSAFLEHTQLYALLCRGVFKSGAGVYTMAIVNGVWKPKPARRNVAHDVELVDVTERVIKDYKKRHAQIMRRYSNVTIVSLTGNKDTPVTTRNLISSEKLNGVVVKTKAMAEKGKKQLEELWERSGSANGMGIKSIREILYATAESRQRQVLTSFAKDLRAWHDKLNKAAEAPYLWYLEQGIHVAGQWFDRNSNSSPVPLFLANKNHMAALRRQRPDLRRMVKKLPSACHGRDDFKDHCMLLFQAAINPKPEARAFYEGHMPWYDYNQDHVVDVAVQAATRTSMRDTSKTEPVLIVVPDPHLMGLLAERLGNVTTSFAQDDYGVPGVYSISLRRPKQAVVKRYQTSDKGKEAIRRARANAKKSPHFARINSLTTQIARINKKGVDSRETKARLDALVAERLAKRALHSQWMKDNK